MMWDWAFLCALAFTVGCEDAPLGDGDSSGVGSEQGESPAAGGGSMADAWGADSIGSGSEGFGWDGAPGEAAVDSGAADVGWGAADSMGGADAQANGEGGEEGDGGGARPGGDDGVAGGEGNEGGGGGSEGGSELTTQKSEVVGRLFVVEVDVVGGDWGFSLASAHFGESWLPLSDLPSHGCAAENAGWAAMPPLLGSVEAGYGPAPALVPWVGSDWPSQPSDDVGPVQFLGLTVTQTVLYSSSGEPGYTAMYSESIPSLLGPGGVPVSGFVGGTRQTPGFAMSTTTPDRVELQEPELGPTSAIEMNKPLRVRWKPSNIDQSTVEVRVASTGKEGQWLGGPVVRCVADDKDGEVEVPIAMLGKLPQSFGTNVAVSVSRVRQSFKDQLGGSVVLRVQHTLHGHAKAKK